MDQFQQLLHQNREWMRQIHEQQMLQMKAMLDQVVTNLSSGMGTQIHVKELDERSFRELGKFEGQDDHWKEWSLKFRAKIKELDMTLFNDLTRAEASEDEITITDVDQKLGADGVSKAAVIYNRLIQHLGSVALALVPCSTLLFLENWLARHPVDLFYIALHLWLPRCLMRTFSRGGSGSGISKSSSRPGKGAAREGAEGVHSGTRGCAS